MLSNYRWWVCNSGTAISALCDPWFFSLGYPNNLTRCSCFPLFQRVFRIRSIYIFQCYQVCRDSWGVTSMICEVSRCCQWHRRVRCRFKSQVSFQVFCVVKGFSASNMHRCRNKAVCEDNWREVGTVTIYWYRVQLVWLFNAFFLPSSSNVLYIYFFFVVLSLYFIQLVYVSASVSFSYDFHFGLHPLTRVKLTDYFYTVGCGDLCPCD